MKKFIILAAAIAFVACKENKETELESENTVIENTDTLSVDTDSLVMDKAEVETDAVEVANEEIAVKENEVMKVEYASFGDKIGSDKALTKDEMLKKYKSLKPGDTVAVKFKSKIKDVCQKKGCWMKMELPNGKDSFVRFRDYEFFVPLNASNQEAIVSGKAFVDEISVAELKHYAKDGGESEEAIAKITEPKITYAFQADGVLISK